MPRVLETVLTGRNLLSPVLASAARDVVAFDSTVTGAHEKAATSAAASARAQQAASSQVTASSARASTAAATGAGAQSAAADKIAASNVKASTSAQASAATQQRAHAKAAESATVAARVQETANRSLATSNGMLTGSLTHLTAGLGGAALALGYAGYRGMEFDSAMSQVQAASQATAGDLERLRDAAIDQGAKTQYSAEEAAQGITEMAKAGVSTADVLNGGLAGALNLAAAGQMEVADAAEIGATALSVFRLEGSQMSHVADLLAAGAGKAQGSVHDLGAALNQSALVADQTGLSIEDTAGALAMFASNGLTGSDAGTSFKTMLQALNPSSEAAATAMDELGLRAYDAQGNFVGLEAYAGQLKDGLSGLSVEQQNATLKTIFGSDAVRAASILYKEGSAGVRQWRDNVNDAGYAQEQAAALTDNLRGDLEKLGGAFDSVMTEMGSGAQGPLRDVVQMLTGLVEIGGDVLGFWNSLPGEVQAAVAIFGALTLLKGPLDDVLGSAAGVIMRAQIRFTEAAAGTSGLAAAAGTARGAIAGLVRAAAPLAGIMVLTSAISSVVEFTRAGDDARESTRLFNGSLEELGNTARGEAVASEIDKIRDSIAGYQEFIDGYEGQNLFNKYVWSGIGEPGELKNADESIAALETQLRNLERTSASLATNTDVLAERFRLSKTEVQELADKYGIDLSESVFLAQLRFGAMYSEEYGTAPTDATNALTGALVSAKAQTEEAIAAQEKWLESLQGIAAGFVDPLDAYSGLLDAKTAKERESAEATAASTEDASDSWEDYVDDVDVSLTELADRLQEQIENQQNWRTNIGQIAAWAGADVAQHLAAMGEEGVDLVAKMADGSSAEAQRMADMIRQDIQLGGMGWTAQMDTEMKNVQAIAAAGGQKTAAALAWELGLGVGQVADIAARYGIVLANGIAPLLEALGKRNEAIQLRGARPNSGSLDKPGFADGGYTGDGGKHEPKGVVHGGEFVFTKEQTAAAGIDQLEAYANSLQGYAGGGFVTATDVPRPYSTAPKGPPISTAGDATMQKGFDEVRAWMEANVGVAGNGTIGGTGWLPIWEYVHARVPQARINSTLRPGDPGRHGRGLAVDFGYGSGPGGAGSAGLAQINRVLHDGIGASLAELIYDGIGDDRPDLRIGKPHTYARATQLEHANHVHAAREKGGPVWPGQNFLVGENGPEIARFNAPATVYPNGTSPAAMPGYWAGAGGGGGAAIDYDRLADALRKAAPAQTTVAVDARGLGADELAQAIVARQRREEFLTGG